MSDTKYSTGSVLAVTEESEGEYKVQQLDLQSSTGNKAPSGLDSIREVDWSFGPVSVDGYLNTDTLELRITVKVVGITIGTFVGNLKDGVSINVDLFVVKGQITFYLKNGNELWVHLELKITFDGTHNGDYKILSF